MLSARGGGRDAALLPRHRADAAGRRPARRVRLGSVGRESSGAAPAAPAPRGERAEIWPRHQCRDAGAANRSAPRGGSSRAARFQHGRMGRSRHATGPAVARHRSRESPRAPRAPLSRHPCVHPPRRAGLGACRTFPSLVRAPPRRRPGFAPVMIRALLIDDEPIARADLRQLLAVHSDIAVVGEARSVQSGRELLRTADYELVFLDVMLIGGMGFDLVPDIRAGARVIFTTGHDSFALRAFEVNALDYLLKPVQPGRLAHSLARLAAGSANPWENSAASPAAVRRLRVDDTVHLNSGRQARFVSVSEIGRIEAQENYSLVCLADGTQWLVRRTLKDWEETLPPVEFCRVHRTTIVNLGRVASYSKTGRVLELRLEGDSAPVSVSREATADVKTRLTARRPAPR
ncbi:MAG: hypothetical protein C0518_04930 [Opitutus sp.]|nr:hypothetical protein [Opitutus sp.]